MLMRGLYLYYPTYCRRDGRRCLAGIPPATLYIFSCTYLLCRMWHGVVRRPGKGSVRAHVALRDLFCSFAFRLCCPMSCLLRSIRMSVVRIESRALTSSDQIYARHEQPSTSIS